MTIFKTITAIPFHNIPANSFIGVKMNQEWLDGEWLDRYAGSLYYYNPETEKMEWVCLMHEDICATIGFYETGEYSHIGDITNKESVTVANPCNFPTPLYNTVIKENRANLDAYIENHFTAITHFVKTAAMLKKLQNEFTSQFTALGINVKAAIIKAVKQHNDSIAKKRAQKAAYKAAHANSIGNMFPQLAAI